ncbi:MAG: hypothetical protein ABI760_17595 [Ferruginibacter sp.]
MTKILMLAALTTGIFCFRSYSQIKYGYAVLYLRCGKEDPERNRIYYSPVIELDRLNFDKYIDGMDPAFAKYSVRYYNYAIAKWFELLLKEQFHIAVNVPEKYERNATSVVFDNKNDGSCNDDKTNPGCFFTDKKRLLTKRNNAINEDKLPQHNNAICEVINL